MAFCLGSAAGLAPFALTYLPTSRQTGGYDYAGVVSIYAGTPRDALNVGPENLVWRWANDHCFGPSATRRGNGEMMLAVTPLLFTFTLIVAAIVAVRWWRQPRRRRAPVAVVLAIAALVAPGLCRLELSTTTWAPAGP